MFDYQAGEKYRLTLIMVAVAGLMAGIFIATLLAPAPAPARRRALPAYMQNSDITGRTDIRIAQAPAGAALATTQATSNAADPVSAKALIEEWLPSAWDLSAGTAKTSQAKAMAYMTADCAAAYQQNIWTPDLSKQIDQSGLKSEFKINNVTASGVQPDGSVIVYVDGVQTLSIPDKGSQSRPVNLEYMVRKTDDGVQRIAGISEGGKGS